MSDADLIERLVATDEYSALVRLSPEFNLFSLLDDTLREPAWSRLFSGILDSTRPHGLGADPLREWLARVAEEQQGGSGAIPKLFRRLPGGSIVRTSTEYTTPEGRRIDVLVKVLDAKHRMAGVIGIENKLDSAESPFQVADYQEALKRVFRGPEQLIVYLTPDGRPSTTADSSSTCPCVPASYRTMTGLCRSLESRAEPRVALLLQSLRVEIETALLGEDLMTKEAKALIQKLWADPDHRRAMRLIIEGVPTLRQLWDTRLVPRVRPGAAELGMQIDDVLYYPATSVSPCEIKICCGGDLEERTGRLGFYLVYMLRCEDDTPEVGSEFCLRLHAYCESRAGRERVRAMRLEAKMPAGGVLKGWDSWQPIWTGGSYTLHDLGRADVEGLASIFLDAARRTYPTLVAEVTKLGRVRGSRRGHGRRP